jgi:hypothetical protein
LGDDKGASRIDYESRWGLLSLYYFLDQYSLNNPYPVAQSGASVPGFPVGQGERAQNFVAQETHTFTPTLVGVLRFSFMRNKLLYGQSEVHTSPESLGFEYSPSLAIAEGPPFIQISGYTDIGNPITATAAVPGNGTFSLGGTQYYSDPSNPVSGNGKITFNRAAPMVTVGWGNIVSRKETKHFSVPVELGVAFQGSPKAALALAGNACDPATNVCYNAATDPTVQSNVQSEQTKINNSMSVFKAYPIISVGFGYKF